MTPDHLTSAKEILTIIALGFSLSVAALVVYVEGTKRIERTRR